MGLTWLDGPFGERLDFCLTFVRGADQEAVLAAFGASPEEAVLAGGEETTRLQYSWEQGYGPFVRVGRAGGWVFAFEEESFEGGRPEVLRRASSRGGEAVAVSNVPDWYVGFGYAADGELISSIETVAPYTRMGSDPDRFLSLIREVGLDWAQRTEREGSWLGAVLTVAERAFGLSIDQQDLERPLLCARMLPVLPDLPAPPDGSGEVVDPVIDLMLAHADRDVVKAAVAAQVRGVLADSGLDGYPALVRAVEDRLAGAGAPVADEDEAGVILRLISWQESEAEQDSSLLRRLAPGERARRMQRWQAAKVAHRVLAWGSGPALAAVADFRAREGDPGWREQFLGDLAGTDMPAAELREARRRWRRQQDI